MEHKRLTLFAGHYGSGKTNLALNWAYALRREGLAVTVADLDIVNPYFRTKDAAAALERAGIGLISSAYANTNLDVPAMPKEIYALVDGRDRYAVLDVGGDDRGALALGRYVPAIREENDYEMLLVVNASRPLTRTAADALAVARENAEALGVAARCRFFQGNLAAPLAEAGFRPDLLICNPPYVSRMDLAAVSAQVRREPVLALDGGADGLALYPELLDQCRGLLAPGGWLVLEHGEDQQEQVWQLCREKGFSPKERLRDLGGRPRAVTAAAE